MQNKTRSTKKQQMQRIIQWYRDETGSDSVDMREVAKFAVGKGFQLPKPKDPITHLAEKFADAAREETRKDEKTGRTYRANLAVVNHTASGQYTLWGDIDTAPRKFAQKAFVQRREHMVGEAVQLTLDVDHWNIVNPLEEPILMPIDFTDDVEERLNAPDEINIAA
ncbi:MAG: hypothetical protein Q8L15_12145 [Methylobacter sp.]|nr:hypothetical protein [Methylobacter sp.]